MFGTHVLHWLGPPILFVIISFACVCAVFFSLATLVASVVVQLCVPVYILCWIPTLASCMTNSPKLATQICAHTLATPVLVLAAVAVYLLMDFCSANAYALVEFVFAKLPR